MMVEQNKGVCYGQPGDSSISIHDGLSESSVRFETAAELVSSHICKGLDTEADRFIMDYCRRSGSVFTNNEEGDLLGILILQY
jgi:hypothetical protein